MAKKKVKSNTLSTVGDYDGLLPSIGKLLEQARRTSARAVNAILARTYWEIGRRIVEFQQQGEEKAAYGEQVIDRLANDLTARFGRGFGRRNLFQIRAFHLAWNPNRIRHALSGKSGIVQTPSAQFANSAIDKVLTPSAEFTLGELASAFSLPWSHYVRILSVDNAEARAFYDAEAIRGGWSVRQLDRQIATQFYERTALSKNKAATNGTGSISSFSTVSFVASW